MYKLPDFDIENCGAYFVVLIYGDYVVKVPRERDCREETRDRIRHELKEVTQISQYLAERLDNVLPFHNHGLFVTQRRAPGVRVDTMTCGLRGHAKALAEAVKAKAAEYKVDIRDTNDTNLFYCKEEDKVYLVDMHKVRWIRE